jgi:hypothetical protein
VKGHILKTKFNLPALALVVICSVLTAAQTQQPPLKSSAEAAKPPAINPLALTDAEKIDLDALANRFNQVNAELQARLQVMLDIGCADCNEAFAVKLSVDDARKFYRDTVKPALMAHSARLAEIQKAHDCLGCALKDGVFVKPEGKK